MSLRGGQSPTKQSPAPIREEIASLRSQRQDGGQGVLLRASPPPALRATSPKCRHSALSNNGSRTCIGGRPGGGRSALFATTPWSAHNARPPKKKSGPPLRRAAGNPCSAVTQRKTMLLRDVDLRLARHPPEQRV